MSKLPIFELLPSRRTHAETKVIFQAKTQANIFSVELGPWCCPPLETKATEFMPLLSLRRLKQWSAVWGCPARLTSMST